MKHEYLACIDCERLVDECTCTTMPEDVNWSMAMTCIGKRVTNKQISSRLGVWEKVIYNYIEGTHTRPTYELGCDTLRLLEELAPDDLLKCTGQSKIPVFPYCVDWHGLDMSLRRAMIGRDLSNRVKIRKGRSPSYRVGALMVNEVRLWLSDDDRGMKLSIEGKRVAA